METRTVLDKLAGRLVVSCQARKGQPFDSVEMMVRMARAAHEGGAAGIRADRPENVRAIREAVPLPIIGVYKRKRPDRKVFITPDFEDALAVAEAGAEIVGIECTFQDDRRRTLPSMVDRLKGATDSMLMAEISNFEEARFAAETGFDLIATTLVGYTGYTTGARDFDFQLLDRLIAELPVPIIAEGHLRTPTEAAEAIRHGAFAVVVGKAITMPSESTRWFVEAIAKADGSEQV
ncbi:MAG TPA: N-acetylmannosamine-6-phosphate 2-epimerase [Spirochaetia bacterium]|nr:N-acetylmannosamine-6-phosphate 2-epimerase [Spirochaetia bacterium]